ncbi:MAG: sulfurtransferase-like selenium metabolism protein YedF [Bacteroidetes bacterium]|nr:MAG: sulfurtransferase-like selenium metabolism protein YedF [Bacteroidota bacterium]
MKTIDVKGMACPLPLIETKKALKEIEEGESLKVIIDNATSVINVLRFLEDNGVPVNKTQNGNITELIVNKQDSDIENAEVDEYCSIDLPADNNFVLVFAKNRIGEGAEELGKMLVNGFLNTFKEMEKLPQKVIFLNSGIDLVLKGSPTIPILKEYEKQGVELLACGTCLEFYNKVDEVAVGRVSNAYDILNATINAGKMISF